MTGLGRTPGGSRLNVGVRRSNGETGVANHTEIALAAGLQLDRVRRGGRGRAAALSATHWSPTVVADAAVAIRTVDVAWTPLRGRHQLTGGLRPGRLGDGRGDRRQRRGCTSQTPSPRPGSTLGVHVPDLGRRGRGRRAGLVLGAAPARRQRRRLTRRWPSTTRAAPRSRPLRSTTTSSGSNRFGPRPGDLRLLGKPGLERLPGARRIFPRLGAGPQQLRDRAEVGRNHGPDRRPLRFMCRMHPRVYAHAILAPTTSQILSGDRFSAGRLRDVGHRPPGPGYTFG